MPMGCVIKFLIVYNRPFWRHAGYSGELVSDIGPCAIAYDKCIMNRGLYALVALSAGYTTVLLIIVVNMFQCCGACVGRTVT